VLLNQLLIPMLFLLLAVSTTATAKTVSLYTTVTHQHRVPLNQLLVQLPLLLLAVSTTATATTTFLSHLAATHQHGVLLDQLLVHLPLLRPSFVLCLPFRRW
jgi:hypothetical protein